jgi:ubiquinone/menaquinone biosynthesis C-methylase UbiE
MSEREFYDGATLHVRSYDTMHEGRSVIDGDVDFYLALARRTGRKVLEVGIGTGRVGVRLAQAGIELTGLDLSADMLAIAARRAAAAGCGDRITLVQGDMRDFSLGDASFGLVYVPFRAFQILLTPGEQRAAVAAFRRHLRPGGILALHLFDPNLHFLLQGGLLERMQGIDALTGRRVEAVMQSTDFDYLAQVRHDHWRYRAFDSDGTVAEEQTLTLHLRWTWRWELHHLLELSGFTLESDHSDFHGTPPAYGKEQLVVARITV